MSFDLEDFEGRNKEPCPTWSCPRRPDAPGPTIGDGVGATLVLLAPAFNPGVGVEVYDLRRAMLPAPKVLLETAWEARRAARLCEGRVGKKSTKYCPVLQESKTCRPRNWPPKAISLFMVNGTSTEGPAERGNGPTDGQVNRQMSSKLGGRGITWAAGVRLPRFRGVGVEDWGPR